MTPSLQEEKIYAKNSQWNHSKIQNLLAGLNLVQTLHQQEAYQLNLRLWTQEQKGLKKAQLAHWQIF